jgi:hypothetical protein
MAESFRLNGAIIAAAAQARRARCSATPSPPTAQIDAVKTVLPINGVATGSDIP